MKKDQVCRIFYTAFAGGFREPEKKLVAEQLIAGLPVLFEKLQTPISSGSYTEQGNLFNLDNAPPDKLLMSSMLPFSVSIRISRISKAAIVCTTVARMIYELVAPRKATYVSLFLMECSIDFDHNQFTMRVQECRKRFLMRCAFPGISSYRRSWRWVSVFTGRRTDSAISYSITYSLPP